MKSIGISLVFFTRINPCRTQSRPFTHQRLLSRRAAAALVAPPEAERTFLMLSGFSAGTPVGGAQRRSQGGGAQGARAPPVSFAGAPVR